MGLLATDQVIKELARQTGEPGLHNYTMLQGYMLDAIRDLNIFTMPVWSTKTLDITSFNTINWPCDCIKPLLTILKRGDCRYLLSVSNDISGIVSVETVESTDDCSVEDLWRLDGFIETFGWNVWSWGLGELYGAETMLPPFGTIIHDKERRQSFIKRVQLKTGDQIILFYKGDGLSECPEFIPSEAKEQTEYFVLQKYFRISNPNLAEQMRVKYKEENYRLMSFYSQATEDEWVRSMNSNTHSSPKI